MEGLVDVFQVLSCWFGYTLLDDVLHMMLKSLYLLPKYILWALGWVKKCCFTNTVSVKIVLEDWEIGLNE